jgi:hypothetical protein
MLVNMGGKVMSLQKGPLRESNPGPPAPEAGIMPLDQADTNDYGDYSVHISTKSQMDSCALTTFHHGRARRFISTQQ